MFLRSGKIVACILAVLLSAAPQVGAANLVGQWDFEGDPATTALQNKVPGVVWSISGVESPTYIEGGKLHCPVAFDEIEQVWGTGTAKATLDTDVPDFMDKTTVLWVIFDKLGDADDWQYLFRIESENYIQGEPGSELNPTSAISWRSGWSQFNSSFRESYGAVAHAWPYGLNGTGPSLTQGQLVKIVEVLRNNGDGWYGVTYYIDTYDGTGLRQYGSTRNIQEEYISAFGRPRTESYLGDFVQFFIGVANLTGDTSGATFEEARIYDGVLTQAEIADLTYTGEPRMIGQWTFDSRNGTDPASNKASGANWSTLSTTSLGASYIDGKLVLARYQTEGVWQQSRATAMLQSDLGENKYFKEMTQIAWVKWPSFDTAADWARLTSLTKFSGSSYDLTSTKAAQGMAMKAIDDVNWAGNRSWEYIDGGLVSTTSAWAINGGIDPPIDKFIKIAQVLRVVDENNYEQVLYWDLGDGNGLVQVGSAAVIPATEVNAFGQNGTDCLVDASGGLRYDGFGIMDHCWSVPQSAGRIEFEEVRLYAGAMRLQDIAEAAYNPTPAPSLVGQWTFDEYGGRGPLASKAPGGRWNNLTLSGTGASIAEGQLVLPRYQSEGVWYQSKATTMLANEMPNHFKEMTQVAWVKWPGYDAGNDWARLTSLTKFPASTYDLTTAKAARGIAMKATDNTNWHSYGSYEQMSGGALQTSSLWSTIGGVDPPTDRYIKVAQVLRWRDAASYEAVMYWDTGSGLVQIGSPQIVWNSMTNFFGQAGSECLVEGAPTGNPRYDGFGIMDHCWNVPQAAGEIRFEEVRLYAGAMNPDDISSLAPVAPTKRLMGQWTFDNYLGTDPLANKAPGAAWGPLILTGTGAEAVDGKLVLPTYLSGTWKQSSAWTMLAADLGPEGYTREVTHVLWLKWPGFDTTAVWARMANLMKFSTNGFINGNWRAVQSLVMKSTDNVNWTGHRAYEYLDANGALTKTTQWANMGGADPPTDRYIKIAQVLRYKDHTQYEQVMYWDLNDGNGLVQVGTPAIVWAAWVNAFGQSGTDCLVAASGGKRYDGYGLMDYCWVVPQRAGEIIFEETRLYGGALTQAEIGSLRYVGEAEPPKPTIGTSMRNLNDQIMEVAAGNYDWVLWGNITWFDSGSFIIDDGSGVTVKVIAQEHGLDDTNYVSVRGSLDLGTNPPTLTLKDMNVIR